MRRTKGSGEFLFEISDSAILFLILVLLISVVSLNFLLVKMSFSKVAGHSTIGTASLCIGDHSTINITSPERYSILSGNISVNATINIDRINISNVSFYLSYSHPYDEDNYSFIGEYSNDGSNKIGFVYNAENLSEGCCYYKMMAVGYGTCTIAYGYAHYLSVDNVPQPPDYWEFDFPGTTNMSNMSQWRNIVNFTLVNPDVGEIMFLEPVTVDGYNFTRAVDILDKHIMLNSSLLPCLGNAPARLTFYNVSYHAPVVFKNGAICEEPECVLLSFENNTYVVNVTSFSTYTIEESHTPNLKIFDQTDALGGNYTRYVVQDVYLYANLTYADDGISINETGVFCTAYVNKSSERIIANMSYNGSSGLYSMPVRFYTTGIHPWETKCNTSALDATNDIAYDNDTVNITNRAPILVSNIPNQTWYRNTVLTGLDLDDYFTDPDGQFLRYVSSSAENINITISASGMVTLIPDYDFNGIRFVMFIAYDPYNLSASSNVVTLYVVSLVDDTPTPPPTSSSRSSSGSSSSVYCNPNWSCSAWSRCGIAGIRTRSCQDLNYCGVEQTKPKESENCTYIPTCKDGIKNQDEVSVDCGGSCPPCPSCSDGVLNQKEEGIDCGGPCISPCPTCLDGIMNQGESGIDCGGPCSACPSCEDNIQNQGESGIDCGGPCDDCLVLAAPTKSAFPASLILTYAFWVLVLIVMAFALKKTWWWFVLWKRRRNEKPDEDILLTIFDHLEALKGLLEKQSTKQSLNELGELMNRYLKRIYELDTGRVYSLEDILEVAINKPERSTTILEGARCLIEGIAKAKYGGSDVSASGLKTLFTQSVTLVHNLHKKYFKKLVKRDARKERQLQSKALELRYQLKQGSIERKFAKIKKAIRSGAKTRAERKLALMKKRVAKLDTADQKQYFFEIRKLESKISKMVDESEKSLKKRKSLKISARKMSLKNTGNKAKKGENASDSNGKSKLKFKQKNATKHNSKVKSARSKTKR